MARPIKNNADYFPHETGMRNDRRIKSLRKRHGAEGYGIYGMLLEVLADAQGLQVKLTDLERQLILDDLDLDEDTFQTVLDAILALGLFQLDDNNILRCRSLDSRLEPVFSKRERSLPVIREFLDSFCSDNPQKSDINTHRIEKNRIGEDSILTESQQIQFSQLYSIYPIKQARTKAELAFSRIAPREKMFSEMMSSLVKQIDAGEFEAGGKKEKLFPESWISQKRWTDEIASTEEEGF